MLNDPSSSESPATDEAIVSSESGPLEPALPQGEPVKVGVAALRPPRLPTIGMALSGGGFRATLFHLGVIRYLRSEDLLGQVKVISSVSGGSILAAHLVLNWNKWSGSDQQYIEAEQEIRKFVTLGLRERIVRRLPFLIFLDRACMLLGIVAGTFVGGSLGLVFGDATRQFIGGLLGGALGGAVGELIGVALRRLGLRYTETDLLDYEYSKKLYNNERLEHLSSQVKVGAPSLCLMTTNLTRHDGLCYFSEMGFFVDSSPAGHAPVNAKSSETLVSRAVTASSAYPGLFRPLEVTSRSLSLLNRQLNPPVQQLSDGGIYDNLGLEKGRDLKKLLNLDYLIISNAGGTVDWEPGIHYSESFARTLVRAADIWQYRINTHPNLPSGEILISINECDLETPGSPSKEVQRLIGRIRTDLNKFSLFEYNILRNHGFSVAMAYLQKIAEQCREVRKYNGTPAQLHPFVPAVPIEVPLEKFAATLGKSSERPKARGFLDFRDWVSWAYPILAMLMIIASAFGLPFLAARVERLNKAMAETERFKYSFSRLDLDPTITVGGAKELMRSGTPIAVDTINRIFATQKSAIKDKSKYLIFVRQKGEFKGSFRSFYGQLGFDSSPAPKASTGKAFLVDSRTDAPGPGYRELVMPVDRDGYLTSPSGVIIDSPAEYEYLVLSLVLESADPKKSFPVSPPLDDHEWKTYLEVR